ncbi:unnamed protein product [Rangifer tarandus platyrhynchus]|uniref:Uncharacterized protein n=2 Tax=Rangifer tarandus platyrhynchus TaxID=3082113 RepID=A0AC59ZAH0_RANTA|nr:unnamed protein product [Rangifer tarandus platyrhynchus]
MEISRRRPNGPIDASKDGEGKGAPGLQEQDRALNQAEKSYSTRKGLGPEAGDRLPICIWCFYTNRRLATLRPATLLVTFFQQLLLTLCPSVTFWHLWPYFKTLGTFVNGNL